MLHRSTSVSTMNRFGFSTKKADNHRPANQYHSVNFNRVSTIGQNRNVNAEFTPSLLSKPSNQLFSLGKDVNSRKLSTGKKINYAGSSGILSTSKKINYAGSSGIPSTAKSVRAMPAMGFDSGRKSSISSKLFGTTPQHSRASYMQKNGASTSRRSSIFRGGKDNRPLSDQAFHRECSERIADFLNTNNYPQQITKQSLLRPSLADVSRIFEFLFSYFNIDIAIKNGANTSLDTVVPKILCDQLGYPFILKRSDLLSFSGGRQLGTVLDSICFVINVISYCNNADASRFNKQVEDFDEFPSINTQLMDIAIENVESEDIDDVAHERLKDLAFSIYGTMEQIEEMEKSHDVLTQNLKNLEEGIAKNVELPKVIQAYKEENKSYDKYLEEVAAMDGDHQKIKQEILSQIEEKEKILEQVLKEKERLTSAVDSQKEIIMQYRLSVERKNQIHDEIETVKQQIQTLDENILASTLEVNKFKAQNSSFIGDLEDVITHFFNNIKASKINQITPDFAKSFEEDKEWKTIAAQLKQFRNWNIDVASDELVREVNNFGQRFQNKFKEFKHKLLEQLSSLNGSASIELICKKQQLQLLLVKKRQQLAESDAELKRLVAEKETKENEEMAQLNQLNIEIDSARKSIISAEKEIAANKKQFTEMKEKISQMQEAIHEAQRHFMAQMVSRIKEDKKHLKAAATENEELVKATKRSIAEKENKLHQQQAYKI